MSYINHVIGTKNELLTSGFSGSANNPTPTRTNHYGLDFIAGCDSQITTLGVDIIALADGTVKSVTFDNLKGWTVVLSHAGNITTHYQHLRKGLPVKERNIVKKTQVIGVMGNTGDCRSTRKDVKPEFLGTHLHFGVQENGKWVDPEPYLTGEKTIGGQSDELDILNRIAWAEARGEDDKGIILVVNVIMNRVKSPGFPNNIRDVVFAPKQFEPVSNGAYDRATPDQRIKNVVKRALDGEDYSQGALFFRTIKGADGGWHETALARLFEHGAHRFYTTRTTQAAPKPSQTTASTGKIEKGNKVKVTKAINYDNGKPFRLWYDVYEVIEVKGDRIVIGVNGVVTAPIDRKHLTKL